MTADRPVIDLGELIEVRDRTPSGLTVCVGDGLRLDVYANGRVTLRATNHVLRVGHLSSSPVLDHQSRVHLELTRKETT